MDREISNDRKLAVLRDRLEAWRNTLYAAKIDYKVGRALGDQQLLAQAQAKTRTAVRATELIGSYISDLGNDKNNPTDEETGTH